MLGPKQIGRAPGDRIRYEAGASIPDVVRTRIYLVDRADAAAIGTVHGTVFGDVRPASTMIVVAGLLDPRWKVEVEVEAVVP